MDYTHAGIDVSAKTLQVALEGSEFEVENTSEGHQQLVNQARCGQTVRFCMESTGVYGLDLAVALEKAEGIEVMVVNPRVARHFAEALTQRSKTDPVDARMLREFAKRMEFTPWEPPAPEKLLLRAFARRIASLTKMKTQDKNRRHAVQICDEFKVIENDIEVNIRHLERRIELLENQASRLIDKHDYLKVAIGIIISVKGIALRSAIQVYGELCVLPEDLTARQWVAHAGLDPRHVESGTFKGKTKISKIGNKYLRAALYMPAHNAIRWEPHVAAFSQHLIDNGKLKIQAKVAVMRKLLHAIHGMLESGTNFDGQKFYVGLEKSA